MLTPAEMLAAIRERVRQEPSVFKSASVDGPLDDLTEKPGAPFASDLLVLLNACGHEISNRARRYLLWLFHGMLAGEYNVAYHERIVEALDPSLKQAYRDEAARMDAYEHQLGQQGRDENDEDGYSSWNDDC
jgi:hypothetical protein